MSNVAKTAVGLMIATIIAKILGFVREIVLASTYGAKMYSDAYLMATNIPLVIFTIIGSTLATVLIPMYFKVNNRLGEDGSLKFFNNIFNIVILICLILSAIGIMFTEHIVKIFAMGFEGEVFNITVEFSKILIVGITFTGLSYVMTSYLQIKNNFIVPGLISVPKNIIIIISIIISVKYNPYIMVWGAFIGTIIEFLVQLPFAMKRGYKYNLYINIKDEYIKDMIWLILPVLIGVAVNQINTMIDRTLASTLVEGAISALNYANKLNGFIMVLFISSIGAIVYPILSKLASENNKEKFINSVVMSINSVILLVIPISVGAIVLAKPIVKILFERGAFDSRATSMTAIALATYSVGMIGVGLRDILGKIFYALQDTKAPMINGVIAMSMNIVLNFILVKYLGLAGLSLSTSISSILCILLLFKNLKNKIGYFGQDKILKTSIKSIVSSIVMGIIAYYIYKLMYSILGIGMIKEVVALFLSIIAGAITYAILVYILKIEESKILIESVKKTIKNKKQS